MNRLAIAILLGVASRAAHAVPVEVSPLPDVGGTGSPGIVTAPDGRSYAVVATLRREERPVSSYVVDYTFAVDAPKATEARGGGHGYTTPLIEAWGGKPRPPRWFVAELSAATPARVISLVEAKDRDAARKWLPVIAGTGLPYASVELGTGAHDVVVVARIRERELRGTATVITADPIDGSPAITVTIPDRPRASSGIWHAHTWTGDHLVLGLGAKRAVVRYLAARGLADAKRWAAASWPPAWISGGDAGDSTRWSAVGTVTASAACGPELVFDTYLPSQRVIETMRVAAPPKVAAGARLAVVLAPNPKDACGRTAHIVRAYASPATAERSWIIDGKAAPAAPLVE